MRGCLVALLWLAGCAGEPMACPSLSSDAEALAYDLVSLGYGEFEGEDNFVAGAGEVLQTQTSWDSAVARWGSDGGLVPDFATEFVFVNRWEADGCGDRSIDYAPWRDGDVLRMVLRVNEPRVVCELSLPQIDLLAVPHGGATDIAWCAPE